MTSAGQKTICPQGHWREQRSPEWAAVVERPAGDAMMAQVVTSDFHAKQGRSTGRLVFPAAAGPEAVYLKRHFRLPLRLRLLAWLWPERHWSPAWVEWQHLVWARAHGLPVPDALAVGERRGPGLELQSYLVIRELTGMLPLHEAVPRALESLSAAQFYAWKRDLVRQIASVVRRMHGARRYHKDLYLCHFFVPTATLTTGRVAPGAVHLIDFHRLTRSTLWRWRWQVKDLAELQFSSQVAGITNRDRLRFLHHYHGARRGSWRARFFTWAVRIKAERYEAHNRKAEREQAKGQSAPPAQCRSLPKSRGAA